MKVQILQEDLEKAVNICSRFASNRVQLPVLANILLSATKNKLRISSTNLEVSVSIGIGAKVDEEGDITIPAKIMLDIVNNLQNGQITLTSDKEILEIKSSEFESQVSGMNALDFPNVPTEVGALSITIPSKTFCDALNKVLFSVSSDEARPVLTGVLLILKEDEIVMVSTDGFRLSQSKLNSHSKIKDEQRFILPKSILSEVVRLESLGEKEISFSFKKSENQVIFSAGNIVMSSRIIDGDFPDFEKIVPKSSKIKLTTDKDEFLRLIKLASVFAKDSANVIKLTAKEGSAEILAESSQHGNQKGKFDAKVDGLAAGEEFTIAFNYRFIEEFLHSVKNDDIEVDFTEPSSPSLFIDPKDTDFFHIIMPVRLQS